MGVITQIRVLGGVIGIAICQAILSSHVKHELVDVLSASQLAALLRSTTEMANLNPVQIKATREAYGRGFNLQTRIMMYFAAASLIISLASFKRHPSEIGEKETEDIDELKRAAGLTITEAESTGPGSRSGSSVELEGVSQSRHLAVEDERVTSAATAAVVGEKGQQAQMQRELV